jgi:hypothetical protein
MVPRPATSSGRGSIAMSARSKDPEKITQLSLVLEENRVLPLEAKRRAAVVALLARLLLEASGMVETEDDDDQP